jgi:hypothetical protein
MLLASVSSPDYRQPDQGTTIGNHEVIFITCLIAFLSQAAISVQYAGELARDICILAR